MKFAIAREHRNFFQKQGSIEFEDFLNLEQVTQFNQAIDQALLSRLSVSAHKLNQLPAEQLFLHGRDLWRTTPELRKLVSQPRFAEVASELLEKKPIRLGYDQFFPEISQAQLTPLKGLVYPNFLQQITTLEQISCIKGVLCGLMLCLSAPNSSEVLPNQDEALEEGIDIFPKQPGHAIFFLPEASVNLRYLYHHLHQRFYLIVYTAAVAHYQLQQRDPHTHALKNVGYILNDKLSDRLNPIVYR